MSETPERHNGLQGFQPCESEVQSLIGKAKGHELGMDFLKTGALDSVAAMFEVHAFTVDAARQKLNGADNKRPAIETMATASGVEISS